MPAPFYCLVADSRCKKPHATMSPAIAEQERLFALHEGRKTVYLLETMSTLPATNFTPGPPAKPVVKSAKTKTPRETGPFERHRPPAAMSASLKTPTVSHRSKLSPSQIETARREMLEAVESRR